MKLRMYLAQRLANQMLTLRSAKFMELMPLQYRQATSNQRWSHVSNLGHKVQSEPRLEVHFQDTKISQQRTSSSRSLLS